MSAQQNLIYNGDFEIYDTCPTNYSAPWDLQINYCNGWTTPTYATSDYFNSCSSSILTMVPSNGMGVQNPKNGNGYCGLIAYSSSSGGCYSGNFWWEYIQGHFISPLLSGHTYNFGFYVSLADYSNIAIKNIGLYISQNSIITPTCSPAPIYVTPNIVNTAGILSDTSNWILISGTYNALGGEKFITIGHFADSLTTDTSQIAPIFSSPFSYYYVDGTYTYDVTDSNYSAPCEIILPNIFTPNDDTVNDVLRFTTCNKIKKISIYNRWGNEVFITDKMNYWDGRTTSGEPCNDGNYFYVLQTEEKIYKGFVQLIR
jgi:gliding motility-associated-like protein